MRRLIFLLAILISFNCFAESESKVYIHEATTSQFDKPSLQRGAKYYMNYCAGCHSLKYMRFERMAKNIGITNKEGEVYTELLKKNLMFDDTDKVHGTLTVAMPKHDVKNWFGVVPSDLSLVIRERGKNWLYTYLHSFYRDAKRPFGSNNELFPDVAMPNVLASLQGEQEAVYVSKEIKYNGVTKNILVLDHLKLIKPGKLTPVEFNQFVIDLVNFLDYVGEPVKKQRWHIGFWVMGFLVIFTLLAYFLKREYWRDVKKK